MSYFAKKKSAPIDPQKGNSAIPMLDESNGCVAGFKAGISIVTALEYSTPGAHEDQEGFVVLEGKGWAKVGAEECALEPETCFIAPAGVPHSIKRDLSSSYVKVCWFHGAIA